MALTVKGFQGTVSDVDMATQLGGHHAPSVRSATDLLVTAVGGARTVNIAAGIADSAFVKVTADGAAAGNLNLTPPGTGGKWYAITLDRQWSPTSTVTPRADDLNVSDTVGGTPGVVAPAALTAAAALPNSPGTSGSAAGQRQVLAFAYVRAADTVLTIFDVRLIRTGAGNLAAPNPWGLIWARTANLVIDGAIIALLRHRTKNGGLHYSSRWQLDAVNSEWLAVGTIETDDQGASGRSSRDDITDLLPVRIGTLASNRAQTGYVFRWCSFTDGTSSWRVWDSDWQSITPVISTGWGSGGAYTSMSARWRYRAGRVRYAGQYQVTGSTPANDFTRVALPVPSISGDVGADPLRNGYAFGFRQGTGRIALVPDLDGTTKFFFSYYAPTGTGQYSASQGFTMYVNTPVAWAANDLFAWDFEYDPF